MKLFDDIKRTDNSSADYNEPIFPYMNRTARKEFEEVRKILEVWFSHYPAPEQAELKSRFRSNINRQHQSAFFELLLHEILVRLDCTVIPHPSVPSTNKTPDFFVKPLVDNPFYIEAVLASNESDEEVAAQARINSVYDVVTRKVDSSNFFLWIDVEGSPKSPPPANKIASFLNVRLKTLDPDQISILYETNGLDSFITWRYEHDGWVINFRPIPKKPEARNKKGTRPIGLKSTDFHSADHRTPIREAINKKSGRYGALDHPYVVAVNILESVDEIDIMEALFGKEQFIISFPKNSSITLNDTQMTRVLDGVWTSYSGPKNTRVSAVLLGIRLSPWNMSSENIRLYHNPWAEKPLTSVLTRLPQAVAMSNHMEKLQGESISSILGLPVSWPFEDS